MIIFLDEGYQVRVSEDLYDHDLLARVLLGVWVRHNIKQRPGFHSDGDLFKGDSALSLQELILVWRPPKGFHPGMIADSCADCLQCGTAQYGDRTLPGSGWIELILWLWLIVPGVIYSIWRRSKKRPTCAACGSRDVAAISSPVGAQLVREYFPDGVPLQGPPPPLAGFDLAVHKFTKIFLIVLAIVVVSPFLLRLLFS